MTTIYSTNEIKDKVNQAQNNEISKDDLFIILVNILKNNRLRNNSIKFDALNEIKILSEKNEENEINYFINVMGDDNNYPNYRKNQSILVKLISYLKKSPSPSMANVLIIEKLNMMLDRSIKNNCFSQICKKCQRKIESWQICCKCQMAMTQILKDITDKSVYLKIVYKNEEKEYHIDPINKYKFLSDTGSISIMDFYKKLKKAIVDQLFLKMIVSKDSNRFEDEYIEYEFDNNLVFTKKNIENISSNSQIQSIEHDNSDMTERLEIVEDMEIEDMEIEDMEIEDMDLNDCGQLAVNWNATAVNWNATAVNWNATAVNWNATAVNWNATVVNWKATAVNWNATAVNWKVNDHLATAVMILIGVLNGKMKEIQIVTHII